MRSQFRLQKEVGHTADIKEESLRRVYFAVLALPPRDHTSTTNFHSTLVFSLQNPHSVFLLLDFCYFKLRCTDLCSAKSSHLSYLCYFELQNYRLPSSSQRSVTKESQEGPILFPSPLHALPGRVHLAPSSY